MRLKIKEVNFSSEENWIFKLSDGLLNYYILDNNTYVAKGLKSPISKYELDFWDVGHSVICETVDIDGLRIVTKVKR